TLFPYTTLFRSGYVARQEQEILRFNKMEALKVPADFDYDSVHGLSNESREKFKKIRPFSIGQAQRISGVRTSDIAILMVAVARRPGQSREEALLSAQALEGAGSPDESGTLLAPAGLDGAATGSAGSGKVAPGSAGDATEA